MSGQFIQLGPFFSGGVVQGGAQLYHYQAGTSTLKDIWEDQGESTALPQPFIADANGIFNFFADGLHKLVICDASGNVIYTLDNWQIVDPVAAFTIGEGEAIASASTVPIGPTTFAHITGSVNIQVFDGTVPFFYACFDGNLTLKNSASLILPNNVDRVVRSGEVCLFLYEGSGIYRLASSWVPAKQTDTASALTVSGPTHGGFIDITGTADITGIATQYAGYEFTARFTNALGLNLINGSTFLCPFGTDYRVVQNEIVRFIQVDASTFVVIPVVGAPRIEPGMFMPGWFTTAPVGGLLMTGAAVNATTYQGLARKLIPTASTLGNTGTSVGNITVVSATDTITLAAHGLSVNDIVHFTNTGGALPTGLTANTVYYVVTVVDANNFKVALTRGGAVVDITGAGSGTNTVHNKVNLPDVRGRKTIALDNLGGSAASVITSASFGGANSTTLGGKGGEQTHTLVGSEIPVHDHEEFGDFDGSSATGANTIMLAKNDDATPSNSGTGQRTGTAGGGGAHSTTDPWIAVGNAIRF